MRLETLMMQPKKGIWLLIGLVITARGAGSIMEKRVIYTVWPHLCVLTHKHSSQQICINDG